jgi:hypothetical protein
MRVDAKSVEQRDASGLMRGYLLSTQDQACPDVGKGNIPEEDHWLGWGHEPSV